LLPSASNLRNPELAEMVAKRQAELMNFKMAFQGYYKNTEELLNSEQICMVKFSNINSHLEKLVDETGIAEEETTGWQEANKTQEAMRVRVASLRKSTLRHRTWSKFSNDWHSTWNSWRKQAKGWTESA
jgi:hypothetical protein